MYATMEGMCRTRASRENTEAVTRITPRSVRIEASDKSSLVEGSAGTGARVRTRSAISPGNSQRRTRGTTPCARARTAIPCTRRPGV